jgi:cation/acetate symporter
VNELYGLVSVTLVCLATLGVGIFGLRLSRATSDFYVAGRAVSPARNASAIGGEYLSAASFLGVAGLIYDRGVDMLWFPVGYTVGYIVLLVMVAAPLRRSGAYTVPDFAEDRLESTVIRRMCSVLVVGIGWLYLLPQLQGAGLALRHVTGWPTWVGGLIVVVVVFASVGAGGMRSITVVQAMQYWLKLTAIAVPAFVLLWTWVRAGTPPPAGVDPGWHQPLWGFSQHDHPVYTSYSTLLALSLGTMGLPHVVVRYYTNPEGQDARRTTVSVIALLGLFYLFPPVYAVLGRAYLPTLPAGVASDTIVLNLPLAVLHGQLAQVMAAVLAGGAFAAFLSTASGLVMSVSGVLDQDLRRRIARVTGDASFRVQGFRLATAIAVVVPFLASRVIQPIGLATTVGLAFALAAATFAPMLMLGVWWRGLSTVGAAAGLVVGGGGAAAAVVTNFAVGSLDGWPGALLAQPAAWCTPLAFAVAVVVSLATPSRIPRHTGHTLVRLHTPEAVLTSRVPEPV